MSVKKHIGREPGTIVKPVPKKGKYTYSEETEKLRYRLEKAVKHYSISSEVIASATGLSRAAITMFIRKDYPNPEMSIVPRVIEFLKRHEEKLKENADIDFELSKGANLVKTAAMARTMHVLNFCKENCELGVVYGPAGVGKTTAIREFLNINRNDRTYFINITPFITGKSVIIEILETLGINTHHSANSLSKTFKLLVRHIKKNPSFLIFDEADLLNTTGLKTLKALYDECNYNLKPGERGTLGMVLCGMSQLFENMTKGGTYQNNDLAQLYGRVIMAACLPKPSREEVEEIVKLYVESPSEDTIDVLHEEATLHGLRRIIKILPGAIKVAEENKTEMSAKVIQAVSSAYMMTA